MTRPARRLARPRILRLVDGRRIDQRDLGGRPPSIQRLDFPVRFRTHTCGSINIDLPKLRRAIRKELGRLLSASQTLAQAYNPAIRVNEKRVARDARACSDYVCRRIDFLCRELVWDPLLDWVATRGSDDELLEELAKGHLALDSPLVREAIRRIGEAGTRPQQERLAEVLRARIAGVRRGPRRKPIEQSKLLWVRSHLPLIESAVREARRADGDYEPLQHLLRVTVSAPNARALMTSVLDRRRRSNRCVELIVGTKLGVGTDRARTLILAARTSS